MKRCASLLLIFILIFSLVACSNGDNKENEELEYLKSAPILGAQIENGENVGFYAFTKNGTYSWQFNKGNGETEHIEYDGIFCLDSDSLCTFTHSQTKGKINLSFTGNVESFKIYSAPKSEIDDDREKILSDEYKIQTIGSTIDLPESGEYYYVVDVKYTEGDVLYGFILTE